jgi:type II secretory pathway component PulJ
MSRFREEAGMTLMEVLTAATVGFVVLAAVFSMLESAVRLNTGVISKTDAMQRGRLAMDVITQELRSQVCLNNLNNPAVLVGATENSVTFYSDFSDAEGTQPPQKRTLKFDPDSGDISTTIHRATVADPDSSDDFDVAGKNLQLENAALQETPDGDDADDLPDGTVPFLRYYAYQDVDIAGVVHPEPTLVLDPGADGLNLAEAARVARIEIAFVSRPTGATTSEKGVNLDDQIVVRHSDPNLSVPDPKCV